MVRRELERAQQHGALAPVRGQVERVGDDLAPVRRGSLAQLIAPSRKPLMSAAKVYGNLIYTLNINGIK
jgi:hypothetical protein